MPSATARQLGRGLALARTPTQLLDHREDPDAALAAPTPGRRLKVAARALWRPGRPRQQRPVGVRPRGAFLEELDGNRLARARPL